MTVTASKKVITGWAMYDWANSVYNLVITTTFFPIYFTAVTHHVFKSDTIDFLGRHFNNASLYSYSLAAAYLVIALLYPILTSIADTRGNKKSFMKFFCYMGSLGCSALYFFTGANVWLGVVCFILASMGFVGSLVFYNSYLPEIAAPEDQDRVSAKGFAFAVDFSRPQHYIVDLFKRLQECKLPVIARVNGHVMAGGFGILCACDMAIGADDIRIGTTESKIGMTPMMILPYMLRILPPRKLQEMCITGEQFSAKEALDWGVLSYAVPRAELDSKLDWLLSRIVDKSPTAIRLGKQAFNAMRDMSLRESLEFAQAMVPVMSSTQDAKEGMAAFQEKRSPNFTGN